MSRVKPALDDKSRAVLASIIREEYIGVMARTGIESWGACGVDYSTPEGLAIVTQAASLREIEGDDSAC